MWRTEKEGAVGLWRGGWWRKTKASTWFKWNKEDNAEMIHATEYSDRLCFRRRGHGFSLSSEDDGVKEEAYPCCRCSCCRSMSRTDVNSLSQKVSCPSTSAIVSRRCGGMVVVCSCVGVSCICTQSHDSDNNDDRCCCHGGWLLGLEWLKRSKLCGIWNTESGCNE
jgi:hypothetical protein